MKTAASFVLMFAAAYGLLLVYVYFAQSRMLYLPDFAGRALQGTPEQAGLPYEDLRLVADDGVTLHGWFVPARERRGTLLFFHGNAGNISHRLSSIALFESLGLDVLIIDYRGYGLSEGHPTEAGTYLDAEAAWSWLVESRGVPAREVVIFGRSLGAAVGAWLAARTTPGAVILESGFTSVPDAARSVYWFLPVRRLSRFRYDTLESIRSVNAPVLVVHSRDDEIIPLSHAMRLHEAAPDPKALLVLEGGHNDGVFVSRSAYQQGLNAFLSRVFPVLAP